jgi:molybdopterin-guanine dinucleotide biosynthesis protein A
MMRSDVTAAIIVGGKARRLSGLVKSLILVGRQTIVDRQVALLRPRVREVVVSAAEPLVWTSLPVILDRHADAGPMAGVTAVLAETQAPWVLAVAGDMPLLSAAVIDLLLAGATAEVDAVVPRVGGHVEPLLAMYGARCLPVMLDRLARVATRMADVSLDAMLKVAWVEDAQLRAVDPELSSFRNINTASDLHALTAQSSRASNSPSS